MAEDLGNLISKIALDIADLKKNAQVAKDEFGKLKSMASDAGSQVKKALSFAGIAVGIYEIAGALKEFAKEAALTGARTETLQISANQIGKTYKMSADSINYFVEQGKQAGITTQESLVGVSKFLTSGLDLTQFKDLATRARDIAVLAEVNTSEAFNRIIQGIITGEQETLRRMMIQVGSQDEVYGRYAASLGKNQLNSVEKAQAMFNEVMRLSAGFAGVAAAADDSVGKQLASMTRFAQEARNSLWSLFGPIMLQGVQEMTRGWKDLKSWADANYESLQEWGQKIASWVGSISNAIRVVGAFIIQNAALVEGILEMVVFTKATGWLIALGAAAVTAGQGLVGLATGVTTINVAMQGWLVTLLAVIGALAAYGAYQTIKKPASVEQMSPEERQLLGEAWVLTPPKVVQDEFEGYEKPLPPGVLGYMSPEARKEKADKEAKAAIDKAKKDAPKPAAKGGKGGKEEQGEDIYGAGQQKRAAERQADVQAAQDSLELLRATNEKKKAELEKQLAEGLIDGQEYYAKLQEFQKAETDKAVSLIDVKKNAQKQAYQDALAAIQKQVDQGGISPEMAEIKRQEEAAKNRMTLAQLDVEAARVRLDGEKRVTEELTRQVRLRQEIRDKVTDLNLETAQLTGAISEQEAKLAQAYEAWLRAKREAIQTGKLTPEMSQALDKNLAAKQTDIAFGPLSRSIVDGLSQLVDAIGQEGADLKQALNNFFKSIFKETLKPGFEQLKSLLTQGFKKLFEGLDPAIASSVASALVGAIALIGMLATSATSSSYSSESLQGGVTASEAVRGIIAGPTSIPIAQIGESLQDALVPTNGILKQIEVNTRGGSGRGGGPITVNLSAASPEYIKDIIEEYFREYLLRGGT